MAAPNGLIVAWPTAASIPSGWSRYTSLDDKVPKPASSSIGSTGGSDTHTHSAAAHTHTDSHSHSESGASGTPSASTTVTIVGSGNSAANNSHTHTYTLSATVDSGATSSASGTTSSGSSTTFARYSVRWIQSDGSTDIPVDAVTWTNKSSIPIGWSEHSASINYILRGASSGANGGTATSATTHSHTYSHNHTHSTNTHTHYGGTGSISGVFSVAGSGAVSTPDGQQQHTVTGSSSSASHSANTTGTNATTSGTGSTEEPSWYKLRSVVATSSTVAPNGIIAMLDTTTVPANWTACDGNNGTPNINGYGGFIKNSNGAGEIGNTGGSNTHTHTNSHSHTSSSTAGTHGSGTVAFSSGHTTDELTSAGGTASPTTTHSHTPNATSGNTSGTVSAAAQDYSSSSNEPAYVNMYFIMSMGTSKPRGIMKSYNELSRLIAKVGI